MFRADGFYRLLRDGGQVPIRTYRYIRSGSRHPVLSAVEVISWQLAANTAGKHLRFADGAALLLLLLLLLLRLQGGTG